MNLWTAVVFLVASLCATRARFICPVETDRSYIVDVSTDCHVYRFCEDGSLKTMVCLFGKAFDIRTSTCQPEESVACSGVLPELGSSYKVPEINTNLIIHEDQHVRTKRGLFDFVYSFGSSFVKSKVRRRTEAIFGTDNAVNNRIILPIVFEMLDDSTSRDELFEVLSMTESALDPIKVDVLRQGGGSFVNPGSILRIPTARIEGAMDELVYNAKPYLTNLAIRHFTKIRAQVLGNLQLIRQSINKLTIAKYASAKELMSVTLKFADKHKGLARTSAAQYLKIHSMYEILNDFAPVAKVLIKVAVEHFRKFPNSIMDVLEGGQLPNRHPSSYSGRRLNSRFLEFE